MCKKKIKIKCEKNIFYKYNYSKLIENIIKTNCDKDNRLFYLILLKKYTFNYSIKLNYNKNYNKSKLINKINLINKTEIYNKHIQKRENVEKYLNKIYLYKLKDICFIYY
jgi:hypothetical protein